MADSVEEAATADAIAAAAEGFPPGPPLFLVSVNALPVDCPRAGGLVNSSKVGIPSSLSSSECIVPIDSAPSKALPRTSSSNSSMLDRYSLAELFIAAAAWLEEEELRFARADANSLRDSRREDAVFASRAAKWLSEGGPAEAIMEAGAEGAAAAAADPSKAAYALPAPNGGEDISANPCAVGMFTMGAAAAAG